MAVKQDFLLSVVVPTYNERENVAELVRRLELVLGNIPWEVVFVDDDSPDGTADLVCELSAANHHVRCIRRIGISGLSSACIKGMMSSSAPYVAVMDADLQHDEKILPKMLHMLRYGNADIVVGTRYARGGGLGEWSKCRAFISRTATKLGKLLIRADVSDPMSGFFAMRRSVFEEIAGRLSGIGFKILLDILASAPRPLRFREIPYRFANRHAGESKMSGRTVLDYLRLLADKTGGRFLSPEAKA